MLRVSIPSVKAGKKIDHGELNEKKGALIAESPGGGEKGVQLLNSCQSTYYAKA